MSAASRGSLSRRRSVLLAGSGEPRPSMVNRSNRSNHSSGASTRRIASDRPARLAPRSGFFAHGNVMHTSGSPKTPEAEDAFRGLRSSGFPSFILPVTTHPSKSLSSHARVIRPTSYPNSGPSASPNECTFAPVRPSDSGVPSRLTNAQQCPREGRTRDVTDRGSPSAGNRARRSAARGIIRSNAFANPAARTTPRVARTTAPPPARRTPDARGGGSDAFSSRSNAFDEREGRSSSNTTSSTSASHRTAPPPSSTTRAIVSAMWLAPPTG